MDFGGSYRRRIASERFHNERDEEVYNVSLGAWKEYKATHSDQFRGHYYATTVSDLSSERLRKTARVAGQEFSFVQWRGSVCDLAADAIVNAANGSLLGGGGVDGAVHSAAGYLLTRECADKYSEVDTCGTVITKGYRLPAHFVIHTVGPVYYHEQARAQERLALCYRRCFELCERYQLNSIGLCCISCGIYGYPPEKASSVAIGESISWVRSGHSYPKVIIFVTFTERESFAYERAFRSMLLAAPDDWERVEEEEKEEENAEEEPGLTKAMSVPVAETKSLVDIPLRNSQVMDVETETKEKLAEEMEVEVIPQAKTKSLVDIPLRNSQIMDVETETKEKPAEEMEAEVIPQAKTTAREVTLAEWKEYKQTHSEELGGITGKKLADVVAGGKSRSVSLNDTQFSLYIAVVDLSDLAVSTVVTVPRIRLFEKGGELLQTDYESKRDATVCCLKSYCLPCDFLVVMKTETDAAYSDCLKACEELKTEEVAVSLAECSAKSAHLAVCAVGDWLKREGNATRTVLFAAQNEEEATLLQEALEHAFP